MATKNVIDEIMDRFKRDAEKRIKREIESYNSSFGVSSTDGPTCPHCGDTFTPDEGLYYDENRYDEDECGSCGKKFRVEVFTQTTWTTYRELEE